jgi:hypothetical protein
LRYTISVISVTKENCDSLGHDSMYIGVEVSGNSGSKRITVVIQLSVHFCYITASINIKKNTEMLIDASKEVGLEINVMCHKK